MMWCEKVELSYPKYLGCFVLCIYKLSFYEDATHRCGESRTRRDSMPINWNKSTKEKKTESTTTCWSVRFCERKIKYFSIFIGLGFLLSFTRERFQKKKITAGDFHDWSSFLARSLPIFCFSVPVRSFEQQAIDLSRDNCADFDTTRGICLLVTQQKKKSREKHTKVSLGLTFGWVKRFRETETVDEFFFSRWNFSLFSHRIGEMSGGCPRICTSPSSPVGEEREPTHHDDGGKESSSSSSWRKWEKITRLWRVCGCLARGKFEDILLLKLSHSLHC